MPPTISAKMRAPSSAVAVVGITEDTDFADGGDAALCASRASAGPAAHCCRGSVRRSTRRLVKYVAIQTFRCGRRVHRRSRRCTSTSPRRGPRSRSKAAAAASASTLPPWPLTKTRRDAQLRRGPAELHQQQTQGGRADRDGAAEVFVLAAGAVSDGRRDQPVRFISDAELVSNRRATPRWRCACRCPAAGEAHAVRSSRPG